MEMESKMEMDELNKIFDCIYTRPFTGDDVAFNDFVDNLIRSLSWDMFEHQEEICHMITKRNPPKLKDGALDRLFNFINNEFGWLRGYIACRILMSYRLSNVDLDDESEWYLREQFDKEDWDDFNKAVNRHIWDDYRKYLGDDKAAEHFTKINRPEYIFEEKDNE